jgi:hypothetical protein
MAYSIIYCKNLLAAFFEVPYSEWKYLNANYESLSYRKSRRIVDSFMVYVENFIYGFM